MSVCEVDPELCQYSGHCWLLCFCVRGGLTSHYQPEYPQTPGSASETKIQESPPPIQETLPKAARVSADPTATSQTNLQDFLFLRRSCMCLRFGFLSFVWGLPSQKRTQTDTHTHSQTHRRFAPIRCATVGRFEIAELKRDALAHAQPFLSV